jgi:hypothetical protein
MESNKSILRFFWAIGLLKLDRTNNNYFTYADLDLSDIAVKYFLLAIILLIEAIFAPGLCRPIALIVGSFLLDRARRRCVYLVYQRNRRLRLIELEAFCHTCNFTAPPALVYCYEHGLISRDQLHEEVRRYLLKSATSDWNKECLFYSLNELLHCAVNPSGGCASCSHFQSKLK